MPRRTRPLVLIHASSQRASSVHELLVAKGFSVLEAQADDIRDLFMEFRPDMVLLEHQEDDQETKELARRLRDTDLGQVVPIILMGTPPGPNPLDIVSMGADQFAALPLDEEWLEEKLARLGGRKQGGNQKDSPVAGENHQKKDGQDPAARETTQASIAPGLPSQDIKSPAAGILETDMDIFRKPSDEDSSSVLGAISDVLSPADLSKDRDIDIDDLDIETTIPGIVDQDTGVLDDDTGESDLDVSDDTDQDLAWKDSRTSRLGEEDSVSAPLPAQAQPGSLGAVSVPPWQRSQSGSSSPDSSRFTAPQRPSRSPDPSPFDPTHLAQMPSSTEVITDGNPASPEQDTVVGLKWKPQERRHTSSALPLSRDRTTEDPGPTDTAKRDPHREDAPPAPAPGHEKTASPSRGNETTGSGLRGESSQGETGDGPDHEPAGQKQEDASPRQGLTGAIPPDRSTTHQQPLKPFPDAENLWIPRPVRAIPDFPVSLDAMRPLDVFLALASHELTSGLHISHDKDGLDMFFRLDRGLLTAGFCDSEDFSFLRWSIRRSFLTREQTQGFAAPAATNKVLSTLLDREILTESQLATIYKDWVAWLFYEIVTWRKGTIRRVQAETVTVPVPVQWDWPNLVCEAVRRKYSATLVLSLVGGPDAQRNWQSEDAMQRALALPDLSLAESKALTMLGEGFPLGECARRTGITESELAGLVHGLYILGILVEPNQESPADNVLSLGSPMAQTARIEAKLEQVRRGDYYSLLGVRPTASLREIRAAHEQMRRSFDDELLAEEVRRRFSADLKLIREVLDEALAVLTHPRYAVLYAEAFLKDRK